ncbi:MAG TPA: universal stress protein [Propionibacteriaceae bacterium]|nr:universal stress protein [Propionibacteriaceae bacterium]
MRVLGWISPGTWPAVVRALHERPDADELRLVVAHDPHDALPDAPASLFGRAHHHDLPARSTLGEHEARALLDQAVAALGRECSAHVLSGRVERVVVDAAVDADRLVLARDGDRSRLGPRSLGPHTRFVLDHAPCTVELLWPEEPPAVSTIPPPPPRPHT